MEMKIDEYTVHSSDMGVTIYDESGTRRGHIPTKEPITSEEDMREIYDVWHNADSVAAKYLASRSGNNENTHTFTEALTNYVSNFEKGKVLYTDDENRVGLYKCEMLSVVNRWGRVEMQYTVCTATQAERVPLEGHIHNCKTFSDFDEAYKYYQEGCKTTSHIWGRGDDIDRD